MWISARTAATLAAAAFLLVMVAMAAPLLPKPHLPALPEERAASPRPAAKPSSARPTAAAPKFGAATEVLAAPDRVRAQRMAAGTATIPGAARLGDRVGTGRAVEPSEEAVIRLLALLRDARTVADPRATTADPAWVVRLVRGDRKVDVMADPKADRLVVSIDGVPVGGYGTVALHKEFAELGDGLFPDRS